MPDCGSGGCSVQFAYAVFENETEKRIIYQLEAQSSGACEKYTVNTALAKVPRFADDFTVEFKP